MRSPNCVCMCPRKPTHAPVNCGTGNFITLTFADQWLTSIARKWWMCSILGGFYPSCTHVIGTAQSTWDHSRVWKSHFVRGSRHPALRRSQMNDFSNIYMCGPHGSSGPPRSIPLLPTSWDTTSWDMAHTWNPRVIRQQGSHFKV